METYLRRKLECEQQDHLKTKEFAAKCIRELQNRIEKLERENHNIISNVRDTGEKNLKEGFSWKIEQHVNGKCARIWRSKWLFPSYEVALFDVKLFIHQNYWLKSAEHSFSINFKEREEKP